MALVLINKDVFEPSYNDLKYMIWNHNYIRTSLIQKGPWNREISMTVDKATRWYELLNFCSVEASTSQACLKRVQGSYPSGRAHIGVHEKTVKHGGFFIDQLHISPFKKLKGKRRNGVQKQGTKNDLMLNCGMTVKEMLVYEKMSNLIYWYGKILKGFTFYITSIVYIFGEHFYKQIF